MFDGFRFVTNAARHLLFRNRPHENHQELPGLTLDTVTITTSLVLLIAAFLLIQPPSYALSFLPSEGNARIDPVPRFAQRHADGRYLVEVPDFDYGAAALDGRALNSYLGAQGNAAASVVFRESSPSALFFNPLVTAFSAYPDNFGVSSVLADDLDFIEQPMARHLERARFVGVRYLVIVSPEIKNRLAQQPGIKARFDSGSWTIFELLNQLPMIRPLQYKPTLVISSLSLKERGRNELDFVRLAEEQFADNWFDVLLARSPESRIDRLQELDGFGALVLDTYQYDDENVAFTRLRDFAQTRTLVLLSSDSALFHRLQTHVAELPHVSIIERPKEPVGERLRFDKPTYRYDASAIRAMWKQLRRSLDNGKIAVEAPPLLKTEASASAINISTAFVKEPAPVLISTTYHPRWKRDDNKLVYVATPAFMLSFVEESASLTFTKQPLEHIALYVSLCTIIILCGCVFGICGSHPPKQSKIVVDIL